MPQASNKTNPSLSPNRKKVSPSPKKESVETYPSHKTDRAEMSPDSYKKSVDMSPSSNNDLGGGGFVSPKESQKQSI